MPRYPSRVWYHPLQVLASNPTGWPFLTTAIALIAVFPFRYKISRYYERQRDHPGDVWRAKAVRHYREIERGYKRQWHFNHAMYKDEQYPNHSTTASQGASMIMAGVTDSEHMYWHSHARDVKRAQTLLEEISALREKVEAEGTTLAAAAVRT